MGIAIPRPAMRSREERIIRLKLTWHALRTGELVAGGMDGTAASITAAKDLRALDFVKLDRLIQKQRKEERLTRRPHYAMRYRPVSFATLPSGLVWEYAEVPKDAPNPFGLPVSDRPFGVFITERPLSEHERETFEIEVV